MVENQVKKRRGELGMTLDQLSTESGIPISTISEVEHGAEPLVTTALKLAAALGKTIEELWHVP